MIVLKIATVIAGLALIAATAHVTVLATGTYGDPHAYLVLAIAAGVGVGALAIGAAWSERRYVLSLGIGLALIAGEAFGLLQTSERLIAAREARQAPARLAEVERARAADRLSALEARLAAITGSSRLTAALDAKAAADRAVLEKAAERGCAANCRALLEQQVAAATSELVQARAEIDTRRAAAALELADARTALAAIPAPASATGLADRLGMPPWALDLLAGALGSLAANGLGCALLAFGAHHRRAARPPAAAIPFARPASRPSGRVAAFAAACLHPKTGARLDLADAYYRYASWCEEECLAALAPGDFGDGFADLVKRLGVPVRVTDHGAEIHDVVLLPANRLALPAPSNATARPVAA